MTLRGDLKKDNDAQDTWKERGKAEIAALREALKQNPKDRAALLELAAALLQTWREPEREQAIKYLEKTAKLDKDFPQPIEMMALDASMDQGRLGRSLLFQTGEKCAGLLQEGLCLLLAEFFLYPQIDERIGRHAAAVGKLLDFIGQLFVHGVIRDFGFHGDVEPHGFGFVPMLRQVMGVPEFSDLGIGACF
jgi:tetratricopeptide (TPR) repeat protein